MLKVTYLHFPHAVEGAGPSGWYVIDASGAVVSQVGRFEHQASAIRAVNALLNAVAPA